MTLRRPVGQQMAGLATLHMDTADSSMRRVDSATIQLLKGAWGIFALKQNFYSWHTANCTNGREYAVCQHCNAHLRDHLTAAHLAQDIKYLTVCTHIKLQIQGSKACSHLQHSHERDHAADYAATGWGVESQHSSNTAAFINNAMPAWNALLSGASAQRHRSASSTQSMSCLWSSVT